MFAGELRGAHRTIGRKGFGNAGAGTPEAVRYFGGYDGAIDYELLSRFAQFEAKVGIGPIFAEALIEIVHAGYGLAAGEKCLEGGVADFNEAVAGFHRRFHRV